MADTQAPVPGSPNPSGDNITTSDQGRGLSIQSNRDTHIGGDVVGHDKITTIITDEKAYDVAGLPNPYLGLRSFTYAERARYAGRERSVEEAVATLTRPGEQRVVLFITGASGSGKSSFAQAGLLPALETHYAERGQVVRRAVFRPGVHPLAARDEALKQLGTGAASDPTPPVPVLVIDQFEELFTQSPSEERQALFAWLAGLPPFSAAPQHIIITLRSDYLTDLFNFKPLWDMAKQGIELRAMSTDELVVAIQCPVQCQYPQGEKRLEPALVAKLAQEAAGEATYLPLLQVTLEELWKKGRLVLSSYGTLTDALKQRADQVFQFADHDRAYPSQLRSEKDRAAIQELFLSLVNVAPDDDPRRDVRVSRSTAGFTAEQRQLTADLSRARLLSVEDEQGEETVNIIHETLLRNWDRLREAIDAQRQRLRQRGRFEQQLQLWRANNRSDDYLLLTNVQLAEARELDETGDIAARSDDAQELLRRSIKLAEARRQHELEEARKLAESERQRAWVFGVGLVVALMLGLLALFLYRQSNEHLIEANQSAATAQAANTQSAINLDTAKKSAATAQAEANNRATAEANAVMQQAIAQNASTQAVAEQRAAQQQAQIALVNQLAAQALAYQPRALDVALLLGVEAYTRTDNFQTRNTLLDTLLFSPYLDAFVYGNAAMADSVAFSPDGKTLASGNADRTIILWDVATRQALGKPLTGHGGAVRCVAFSPDGKTLASGSTDGTVILWDMATRQMLNEPLTGSWGIVVNVAFSPDGKTLASSFEDGTLILWDVATQQVVGKPLSDPNAFGSGAAFSPDGKTLASGGEDGNLILWDVATQQAVGKPLTGQSGAVRSLAFSPDGKMLASGSEDGTLILWDVATRQMLNEPLPRHSGAVLSVAFSPDGKILASGNADNTINLWDVATRQALLGGPLAGHSHAVQSVAFSPDGKILASVSVDHTIILWDVARRQTLGQPLTDPNTFGSDVAFSPDGKTLASGGEEGTLILWDVATGQALGQPLTEHSSAIWGVAFSPDGKTLASGDQDGTLILWDVATRQMLNEPLTRHSSGVLRVAFSPDGKTLASGSNDGTHLWDVATRQEIGKPLTGQSGATWSVAFSPDGRTLASGSDDGTVLLRDMATRQALGKPLTRQSGAMLSVAFSPDGKTLASGNGDNTLSFWDVATRQMLGGPLAGHSSAVWGVAFSPDGKTLASGDQDGTLIFWDVATQQMFDKRLTGGPRVAFSPDGKTLASGGHPIMLWDMDPASWAARACRMANRNLTQEEWKQFFGDERYRKTCPNLPEGK